MSRRRRLAACPQLGGRGPIGVTHGGDASTAAGSAVGQDAECRKNWTVRCEVCGEIPTVGDTELCGPHAFGEAETINGNW